MTHYKGPEQREKRMEAWEVCLDALEDDDTHLSAFCICSTTLLVPSNKAG